MTDEEFDRLMRMSFWRRIKVKSARLWQEWHPSNATCNNPDCGYPGRRIGKRKWCPACYADGAPGELILDPKETK